MMNKVAISLRNLSPLESHPAEILDHRIDFNGLGGYAEAVPKLGASFHGVLHKMTRKDMKALDRLEGGYQRIPATVRLYNNTLLPYCSVYSRASILAGTPNVFRPSERYMSLLIQGCEQHNVKKSYIDYLRSIPSTPYRRPSEYKTIPIPPNLPTWTEAKLLSGNGKFMNPFYFAVNGKIFEYSGPRVYYLSRELSFLQSVAGSHLELILPRGQYDPKYPPLSCIRECSPEQSASVEDSFARDLYPFLRPFLKVVAKLDRSYEYHSSTTSLSSAILSPK